MSEERRQDGQWKDWQEWRDDIDGLLADLRSRADDLTQRMVDMEIGHSDLRRMVTENTALTQQVASDTRDLVEWTKASQGAFRVLVVLGNVAKWGASIAAALGAAYAAWHGLDK